MSLLPPEPWQARYQVCNPQARAASRASWSGKRVAKHAARPAAATGRRDRQQAGRLIIIHDRKSSWIAEGEPDMGHIKIALWGSLALLTGLWLLTDASVWQAAGFFPLRDPMVQLTGVLAMGCMSIAMVLALRPRWPEQWLGGLDKMYRLHKWLGIGGLVLSVTHWLWSQGPKWAVGLGLLERPQRGPRGAGSSVELGTVEQFLRSMRGTAEGLGEWAFYAFVLLVIVALVRIIPYRIFHKTHRVIAAIYLVLIFHTVVLYKFSAWATPLGLVMALLLAAGTVAAIMSLFGLIGASRKAEGRISCLHYYPSLRVLEGDVDIPQGWPGHKAGQFAFVSGEAANEAHPFTIASDWHPEEHKLTFITKELGDFTSTLRDRLAVGQRVTVEGPYGCFTFEDDRPAQIWVGGGIGMTPFIAAMRQIARAREQDPQKNWHKDVFLFYATGTWCDEAIGKIEALARSAGIRLHVHYDKRDGLLTGERIREKVPGWRDASIWFCGPVGFGKALRQDFARYGFDVRKRFHQELFEMR